MRKTILYIVGLWLFSSCEETTRSISAKGKGYSILVAGHVYGNPNVESEGLYDPFRQYALQHKTTFDHIVFTGDVVRQPKKKYWDLSLQQIDSLETPYSIALGNHDIGDRSLIKTYVKNPQKIIYLGEDALLILDNTQNGWAIDKHQLDLVKEGLKTKGRLLIFVHNVWWHDLDTTHSNCFHPNSLAGKAPENYLNFKSSLLPLLFDSKKEVILVAGDVGATNESPGASILKRKNITFLASGMGNGITDNVLEITLSPEECNFNFIALGQNPVEICGSTGL